MISGKNEDIGRGQVSTINITTQLVNELGVKAALGQRLGVRSQHSTRFENALRGQDREGLGENSSVGRGLGGQS